MKAGNFNIYSYLDKLNEEAEMVEKNTPKVDSLGMVIPEENIKTYNWLKSEYQKGKTEVKVEMNLGGSKFEPGYDMQGNIKSVDSFKPGMYGAVKTGDTSSSKKEVGSVKPAASEKKNSEDNKDEKSEVKGKSMSVNIKTKKNAEA